MTIPCYACPNGTASHHQDGAKSWIQCSCGKMVGPKIDMSDLNHLEMCLNGWNKQADLYLEEVTEGPCEQTDPPEIDNGTQAEPIDQQQQRQDHPPVLTEEQALAGGVDPVDVHANFNTDLPSDVSDEVSSSPDEVPEPFPQRPDGTMLPKERTDAQSDDNQDTSLSS